MRHLYYDRNGQPLTMRQWSALLGTPIDDRRVAYSTIGDTAVSTVWLGLDHNYTHEGPPLIFETLIMGGEHDDEGWRWPTLLDAEHGHQLVCQMLTLDAEADTDT